MITLDLFEQDPNFRKPVEYETRKQFGTVNFANLIKAYQSKPTQPVQFDFPGGQSYKLSAQWVDMLADYYNTLETNNDRAQLIYGTLIDYNKTLRFLNTLAQQKLFEKSSSADPEFKSAKLARLKTQARAKYPAAANDMEALATDFIDGLEKDQKEFEKVKRVNRRQDELLKQITALNKEQDDEIKDLEGEESELQRNIQQIQSANAELVKKLAAMSARRSSKKDSTKNKDQQAATVAIGATAIPDVELTKAEPTEVEPKNPTPAGSAMADIVKVATGANVKPKDRPEPVATSSEIPSEIPKQPDNVIDLFPDSDIPEPEKQTTLANKPDVRSDNVFDFPTRLQKTDDEVRTGTNNESVNENKIPAKQVMQGYVVEFNPKTNVITIGQRGQILKQFKLKTATRRGYEQLVNKFIHDQEDLKYPDDIEDRDVRLPMKESGPETWTVHFTDGTKTVIRVASDEVDPAIVRQHFAKQGKTVKKFDYGYGSSSEIISKPEPHEPGSGTAVSGRTGDPLPEDMRSDLKAMALAKIEKALNDPNLDPAARRDFEARLKKIQSLEETGVDSFNRGGHNALKGLKDYQDKRAHLFDLVSKIQDPADKQFIRQRLLDLEFAARKQGLIK